MPAPSPATGHTTFRLALLAMLLSVWLIGRSGGPDQPASMTDDETSIDTAPATGPKPTVVVKDKPAAPDAAPAEAGHHGHITGFVRFTGDRPSPRFIDLSGDPYCQGLYAGRQSPRDEGLVIDDDRGLRNALIYVSAGLPQRVWPPPPEPVLVHMIGCRFEPHVAAVMLGQHIEFINMDETLHNVHTLPAPNPEFGVRQPAGGFRFHWTPTRPEVGVYIKCDVHAWMSGRVHVLAHPFFAITGPAGAFAIKDLPAGEYELQVWHEMKTLTPEPSRVKVKVEAGRTVAVDITMSMME